MLQQKTKALLGFVEESSYIPIVGSLLIGFVIAWSIRQPGFQEPISPITHHIAPILSGDFLEITKITDKETDLPTYGEFQPLHETPLERETVERNNKLPLPELFVKTTRVEGGYLISFSITNFVVGNEGYLLLEQENTPVTRIYASPYFIDTAKIDSSLTTTLILVNNDQQTITSQGKPIQETVTISP